jgi:hypothetical protein
MIAVQTTAIARYAALTRRSVSFCSIFLIAGLGTGCDHPSPDTLDDGRTCVDHQCKVLSERVAGDFPELVKGASFEMRDFRSFCRLDVSWPVSTASAAHFHAMIDAQERELIPLPLGLVKVHACRGLMMPAPTSRPYAILILNPDVADWPALEPNDVFIPLDGDAALDETFFASARVEPVADGKHALPSVSVSTGARSPRSGDGYREGLHEGDSFPWGDTEARIVRIVSVPERRVGPVGWVEVSLSAGAPQP